MLLNKKYTLIALLSTSILFSGISDRVCKYLCKDCSKPCCEENYKLHQDNFEYRDLLNKNNIEIESRNNEVSILEAQKNDIQNELRKAIEVGDRNVAILEKQLDENTKKLEKAKSENKLLDSLNLVKDTTIINLNSANKELTQEASFLKKSNVKLEQTVNEKNDEISKNKIDKTRACRYLKKNLLEVNISYYKRFLFWKVSSTKSFEKYLFEKDKKLCLSKIDSIEIKGTICLEDIDMLNKPEYKFCIFEKEITGAMKELKCESISLKQVKDAAYLFNIKKLLIPKNEDLFQVLNSKGKEIKIEIRSHISTKDNELLKTYNFITN